MAIEDGVTAVAGAAMAIGTEATRAVDGGTIIATTDGAATVIMTTIAAAIGNAGTGIGVRIAVGCNGRHSRGVPAPAIQPPTRAEWGGSVRKRLLSTSRPRYASFQD
jgi:hypothetical protein